MRVLLALLLLLWQAQADREVPNDQVLAVVAAEDGGRDPAAIAAAVNKRMSAALAVAREYPAVRTRTAATSR
ncbi:MAG: hypothetical protein ACT4P4_05660 [Betaproteobacteria bacterium]